MVDHAGHKNAFRIKRYFAFKPPRFYCSACRSSFSKDTRICPRCKAIFYTTYFAPMNMTEDELFSEFLGENRRG